MIVDHTVLHGRHDIRKAILPVPPPRTAAERHRHPETPR